MNAAREFAEQSSTRSEITVVRVAGGYHDRIRRYKVVIDGQVRGAVKAGSSRSFPVPQGDHTLSLSIDWCSSRTIDVTLHGEPVIFACCPSGQAPLVAVTAGRGSYIDLWQVEDAAQVRAIPVVPLIGFRGRPGALPTYTVTLLAGLVVMFGGTVGMPPGRHQLTWHDAVALLGMALFFGSLGARALSRRKSRRAAKPG